MKSFLSSSEGVLTIVGITAVVLLIVVDICRWLQQ